MGRLDPVSIEDLAVVIRDRQWVDMRVVGTGTFERVQIEALVVRREDESVEVRQEYMPEETDEVEEVMAANHTVDAEAIMWLHPSSFEIEHVNPVVRTPELPFGGHERAWAVAEEVVAQSVKLTAGELREITKSGNQLDQLQLRYWVMLVMKEITDIPSDDMTYHYGYKSQMPWQCASWLVGEKNVKNRNRLKKMVKAAKKLGAK